MAERRLIFVYNADSGLFNTATDIAHKILSPDTYSCNLCALTHGYFSIRENWVKFLESLPIECDFLHRDEFHKQYDLSDIELPAMFTHEDSQLKQLLSHKQINQCETLEDLKTLIQQSL